jgi:hypothetical protein
MSWHVARPGRTEGPYTDLELTELARSGALQRDDRVARPGDKHWRRAGVLLPDAFPRAGWFAPMLGLVLVLLPAAYALSLFQEGEHYSAKFSVQDFHSLVVGATAMLVAAIAAGTWLLARPSRLSTRWAVLRMVALSVGMLAVVFTSGQLLSLLHVAAALDSKFVHTLESKAPGVLQLSGGIGRRLAVDLESAVTPTTRTLVIVDSLGGSVDSAIAAANFIRSKGLTVRVERSCMSACVALFAAARRRELYPNAVLGLHQSSAVVEGGDASEVDRVYDELLRQAGFSEAVLARRAKTMPDGMDLLLPTRDAESLPSFVFVDERSNRPLSPGHAGIIYVAAQFSKDPAEAAQLLGQALQLAMKVHPELASLHGVRMVARWHTRDVPGFQTTISDLVDTAFQRAMPLADPEVARAYWRLERQFAAAAFARGDYSRCGSPGLDKPTEVAAFIRAKNDVMSSSLRSSIAQVEPTEQDLARYRQRIVALMPNLNIPASEFDPPSPRAVCAMSLAMADAIIKGNDSDVRLFAAMNSQQ